jgi:SAM-dependent methyltransferase
MSQADWQQRYAERDPVWSGRVNPWLAEVAGPLPPGRALDLACGEGADAIHLAERGWHVTAVDFAPAGLARGQAAAAQSGVDGRIHWVAADITELRHPVPFDLVTISFFHPPDPATRDAALLGAWQACAGVLLVVAHDPASAPLGPPPHLLYGIGEVLAALGGPAEQVSGALRQRSSPAGVWTDAVVVARR